MSYSNLLHERPSTGLRVPLPRSPSVWLLGICLVFAPLASLRVTELISIADVLFALAAVCGLVERMIYKAPIPLVPAYFVVAILLTICYLVNIDVVDRQHDELFLILLVNAVLVPVGILFVRTDSLQDLEFLIIAWTAGALYGAAFVVAYCNGLVPWHTEWSWTVIGRAQGLTPHPNMLSLYSVLAFPGLFLMMQRNPSMLIRAGLLVLMGIAWMAVDYGGSRSAPATLGVLVLCFLGLYSLYARPQQRAFLLLGVVLAVVAFVFVFYIYGYEPRVKSALWRLKYGALVSDEGRAVFQSFGITGFNDAPIFGQGFQWMRVSHNVYLQTLHSAGLVGFVAYMAALLLPLLLLVTVPMKKEDRIVVFGLCSATVAVLFNAWVRTSITDLNATMVFAMSLLAAITIRSVRARESVHPRDSIHEASLSR